MNKIAVYDVNRKLLVNVHLKVYKILNYKKLFTFYLYSPKNVIKIC